MARCKGTGTLLKRGKYYLAKWVVDGQVYYKSTKESDKKEAKKRLDEFTLPFRSRTAIERIENLQAQIRCEEHYAESADDRYANCKIDELLDLYMSTANAGEVKPSSLVVYNSLIAAFAKFLSEDEELKSIKVAKQVTRDAAEKFLVHLRDEVGWSRYNMTISLLRRLWREFGKLSSHKCFKENIWMSFNRKKNERSCRRELTIEELSRISEVTSKSPHLNLLFCLGIYTGMRKSDCCLLRWSEVDFVSRVIRRVPMKTDKSQQHVVIPIHNALYQMLLDERAASASRASSSEEEKQFVSPKLKSMYEDGTLSYAIRRVFKEAGIEMRAVVDGKRKSIVSFHSLRHTFVSIAASKGISLDIIKGIVGHTSTAMTSNYTHLSQAALSTAVSAIPSIGCSVSPSEEVANVTVSKKLLDKLTAMGASLEDAIEAYIGSTTIVEAAS